MKKYAALAALFYLSQSYAAPAISDKSSEQAQVGYSFGYLMGKSNSNSLNDLDFEQFLQGFKAGYTGQPAALSNEHMINILSQFKKKADAKELVDLQKVAADNLKAGNDFLKNNLSKNPSTVKVTVSGLQYQVLREGTGARPTLNQQVKVNYEGRLIDGTVFDSSIARDESVTFPLKQVIAGWQEGLQLMREGGKYRFYIPAKLAYGEVGAGSRIAPNSTLIFDIELLKVL